MEYEEAMTVLANKNREGHSTVEKIAELESLVATHEATIRKLVANSN